MFRFDTASCARTRGVGFLVLVFCLPIGSFASGQEKLKVVTSIPVLADLARTIGGERVEVDSLADPRQDPHFVQPRPTLMKQARRADLFIEIGLQLEIWVEKVVGGSGNLRIQHGQPGRLVASKGIKTIDVPQVLSRALGDVHPYGNPHVWLDPIRAKILAANIANALAKVDPSSTDLYRKNLAVFEKRLDEKLFGADLVRKVGSRKLTRLARQGRLLSYLERRNLTGNLGGWMKQTAAIRGKSLVTYHKTWSYLAERFGIKVVTQIEEKPGIAPSAKHRDHVIKTIDQKNVRAIALAPYYDRSIPDAIASRTGCRVEVLPIEPGGRRGAEDYISLMDYLVNRLIEAMTS